MKTKDFLIWTLLFLLGLLSLGCGEPVKKSTRGEIVLAIFHAVRRTETE